MSTSIRISKKTYEKLVELAGILQANLKRTVSIDDAIKFLLERRSLPGKITELSGSWEITDEQVSETLKSLKKGWNDWNLEKFV